MKKRIGKLAGLLLALVMAFAMAVPAFAAGETDTAQYTVTIYVQQATRDTNGNVIQNDTKVFTETPITVTVDDGQTLKDAINAASEQSDSVITNPVWEPTDDQYLTALTVNGTTLTNENKYFENTPEEGKTTYQGKSWMYFDAIPEQMPASSYDYPNVSLGKAVVNADMTITLSYEQLTYIW